MLTHILFAVFVALAVYAQSTTGFALALILLGLVGLTDLVPLPDAANAVTVLIIVNALIFFYSRRIARVERSIIPAVAATLVGAFVGMGLLTFLAANAYQVLRMLLGFSVVLCAVLLWRKSVPFSTTSSSGYFTTVGLISGILGGLFSAAGPPLVYAVYRQPWSLERIQESLIFCFAVGAVLRLIIMAASGNFSPLAVMLTIEALPVTAIVTAFSASWKPPVSSTTMKYAVCVMLIFSGVGMLISSIEEISTQTLATGEASYANHHQSRALEIQKAYR